MSEVISKVSPAVTAALDDSEPVQMQLPVVELSHSDQCEYVSVVDTFVQVSVALEAIEPDAAAFHATDLRVVSVAALLVPSSPGSPVCNFTYTVVGAVHAARPVA